MRANTSKTAATANCNNSIAMDVTENDEACSDADSSSSVSMMEESIPVATAVETVANHGRTAQQTEELVDKLLSQIQTKVRSDYWCVVSVLNPSAVGVRSHA